MNTQLFQNALQYALLVAGNLLAPAVLVDELGNPLACDVRADYAATAPAPTICHVGLDPGPISYTENMGELGLDADTGTQLVQAIYAQDSALVFSLYTTLDAQRRYLADWLIWNLVSGYAVQGGVRVSSYPLVVLRNHGIIPQRSPLFDKVGYTPENLGESRPFGLPWRAVLRLRCTLIASWGVPPFVPTSGVLNIFPTNPPGNLGPPSVISFE